MSLRQVSRIVEDSYIARGAVIGASQRTRRQAPEHPVGLTAWELEK